MRKLLNALRDGWLMVGIALVMFLLLEGAYRLVAGSPSRGEGRVELDSSAHPYAGQPWFAELTGDNGIEAMDYRLDPYRGHWPAPLASPWLNVDSAGRRRTVSTVTTPETVRRVYMLGGSSMWGFAARDSLTIPSLLATALARRGVTNVEVVNLAQPGFNATQGATTLLVELARGGRPDVAVFFDGYNDMATGLRHRKAGHTFAEAIAQRRIDLGKRGFWGELFGLGRHSRLIQRLTPAPSEELGPRDDGAVCQAVADYYRRVHLAVEGIGSAFNFRVVRLMQPHHGSSGKTRTPWERSLGRGEVFARCTRAVDSAMADRLGTVYFPAYTLFDQDTASVFVDRDSHITEAANTRVAEYLADIVAPMLTGNRPDSTATP